MIYSIVASAQVMPRKATPWVQDKVPSVDENIISGKSVLRSLLAMELRLAPTKGTGTEDISRVYAIVYRQAIVNHNRFAQEGPDCRLSFRRSE